MNLKEIVIMLCASIGGIVGWNVGQHFFHKPKVIEKNIIAEQPPKDTTILVPFFKTNVCTVYVRVPVKK